MKVRKREKESEMADRDQKKGLKAINKIKVKIDWKSNFMAYKTLNSFLQIWTEMAILFSYAVKFV